jgi:DNA-binding MarR family transcriptional regulator
MVRIHTAYVDRKLAGIGLRNGQGAIISALGQNGQLTQNQLAKQRQVSAATISVMLGRMVRDGLVERNTDAENGRANVITLTDEGYKVYERLSKLMEDEPGVVFAGLTQEDKQAACKVFSQIAENLAK